MPIVGSDAAEVVARILAAGDAPIWPHIPTNGDIHRYRRDYAQAIYAMHARDIAELRQAL